jgi:hypothetical protein
MRNKALGRPTFSEFFCGSLRQKSSKTWQIANFVDIFGSIILNFTVENWANVQKTTLVVQKLMNLNRNK